jgi:hypothetical protein
MTNDEGITKFKDPADYIVIRASFVIHSNYWREIRVIRGVKPLIRQDRLGRVSPISRGFHPRLLGPEV